ncbi:MAG: serine hydrolase domain-containing protein [Myxococcota bacterium]
MRSMFRLLPLVLVVACGPATTATVAPEPTPTSQTTERETEERVVDREALAPMLDEYIGSFGQQWGPAFAFSGFVLVAEKGEPVYARGFSYADRAGQRVADADTNFRVGSVTKQFTAAAILELEERGKLSVTDPVSKHFPDWPRGDAITIHHLLTHTAGMWSYTSDFAFMKERIARPYTTEEMLALFRDHPLDFEPGQAWSYSNSGYVLLGAIIEKVHGKPYADAMHELVFEPAGLSRTMVGDAPSLGNRALGYTRSTEESVASAAPIDMSVPHGAGAVRSTPNDLVAWHAALGDGSVLGKDALAKLYTPDKNNYAYGWIITEFAGQSVIAHNGGINGFGTFYMRVPEDDVVVVAWTNVEGFDVDAVGKAAMGAAYGNRPEPPEEPPPKPVDAALAAGLVGSWAMDETSKKLLSGLGLPSDVIEALSTAVVMKAGDTIAMRVGAQDAVRLYQASDTELFAKIGGVRVTWDPPGEDGNVPVLRMRQGGPAVTFARVTTGAKR